LELLIKILLKRARKRREKRKRNAKRVNVQSGKVVNVYAGRSN
tara:strand:- start:140 stop:268 length:129 start_codon:yes stop_codon:yes gene_type:complete